MKEIALHILDIAENCIAAGAGKVAISVQNGQESGLLSIRIVDSGKGMNKEEVSRCSDPFFTSRTTRKVGLGIPMLRQHAEMCGGGLKIQSASRRNWKPGRKKNRRQGMKKNGNSVRYRNKFSWLSIILSLL